MAKKIETPKLEQKTEEKWEPYGTNIEARMVGTSLLLKIDTTKEIGASMSGKTVIIATTNGNKTIPGNVGIKIGVNVFKYPPKRAPYTM